MLEDKILIICSNNIPPLTEKNFKTISLNNQNIKTDLICYYSYNCFKIGTTIIQEEKIPTVEYISSHNADEYIQTTNTNTNTNIITFKKYQTNIYLKLAYILWILGYKNIGIYGLEVIDKSIISNIKTSNVQNDSINIENLIGIYSSHLFADFLKSKNIQISLIQDDITLSKEIPRLNLKNFENDIQIYSSEKLIDQTLYELLFESNDTNIDFIRKYYKIIVNKPINPDDLLSFEYLIINKDQISFDLANIYINNIYGTSLSPELDLYKYWVNKLVGLPLNKKDFDTLIFYYNFDPEIYRVYINDISIKNYTSTDLFIHWLLNEKDKFIFNFPFGFNLSDYLELNPDLKVMTHNKQILRHFLVQGRKEERNIYKYLVNFDWKIYSMLNDLNFSNKYDAEVHYLTLGKKSGLLTSELLPQNFSVEDYIKCNPDLKLFSHTDALKHYLKYGKEKYNYIRLPHNFSPQDYLKINPDIKSSLKSISDKDIIDHFIKNGIYENRQICSVNITTKKRILCICHNGNMSIFKKIEKYIDNLLSIQSSNIEITLFICSLDTFTSSEIESLKRRFPTAKHFINENFGFDIGSFFKILEMCKNNSIEFDYVIKIHTKTNDLEREKLLKPILGSTNRIKIILDILSNDSIGLVGSVKSMFFNYGKLAIHNQNHLKYLLEKFNIGIKYYESLQFIGGTMFWCKFSILKKIFWNYNINHIIQELNNETSLDWNWYMYSNKKYIKNISQIKSKEDAIAHYINSGQIQGLSPNIFHAIKFKTKSLQIRDAMIEHAYERFFSYAIEGLGYTQYFIQEESFVDSLKIKPLPIVFPQFHPIPENDKFWSKGFTEWTLLNKIDVDYTGKKLAKPHKSLGQYNILDPKYIEFIEKTTSQYSIPALCYYHYWFNGHKVMYEPIEQIRDSSKPNINYCLTWANETWSARWDGLDHNVLIKQEYGEIDDWIKHIQYLLTFFKDPKYIKIANKPLFFIYRPIDIPIDIFNQMIQLFNTYVKLKENGFDGLELIINYNNTPMLDRYPSYLSNTNVSGVLDFNPNYINTKKFTFFQETDSAYIFEKSNQGDLIYNESIYLAYNPDVKAALDKKQIQSARLHYESIGQDEIKTRIYKSNLADINQCYDCIEAEPRKHHTQLYSTFMDWNNSPRRDITKLGIKPTIFLNSNPSIFKKHLKNMIFKIIKDPNPSYNYLLINAWNEWNEQTCLEPSDIYEYKYLEACKDVFTEYY